MEKQNKRKKLEENILVMDCRKEMNKKKERINKNEECTTRGGVREGRGESKEKEKKTKVFILRSPKVQNSDLKITITGIFVHIRKARSDS